MGVSPFIRLGSGLLTKGMIVFQRLIGTNTLAYPAAASVTRKKKFYDKGDRQHLTVT
jgi:hypothetical protein